MSSSHCIGGVASPGEGRLHPPATTDLLVLRLSLPFPCCWTAMMAGRRSAAGSAQTPLPSDPSPKYHCLAHSPEPKPALRRKPPALLAVYGFLLTAGGALVSRGDVRYTLHTVEFGCTMVSIKWCPRYMNQAAYYALAF